MGALNTNTVHFKVDARASLFTVQAFASGIAAVIAHSPKFAIWDFTGDIEFVPANPEKSTVQLKIPLGSLELMDELPNAERKEIERVMFQEILENKKYPTVDFQSSRVTASKTAEYTYRVNVVGNLSLHGTTRGISLECQIVAGEQTLKAQGSFSLIQSEFDLQIASVAGGSLRIKDELKLGYFLVCRRQD